MGVPVTAPAVGFFDDRLINSSVHSPVGIPFVLVDRSNSTRQSVSIFTVAFATFLVVAHPQSNHALDI